MQKFVLKTSAALMLAGIAGQSFAAANVAELVPLAVVGGVKTFATELSTAPAVISGIDVIGDIGFGVSAGQTRFIRYDLTNATFSGAVAAADLTTDDATPANNITVVQGGGAGQSFVIFQITADVGGLGQFDDVLFDLDPANITAASIANVSLQYRLYETAANAANPSATGLLSTATATIASFSTGLAFANSTANTTTASVGTSYQSFVADLTLPFDGFVSATESNVGELDFGAVVGVLRPVDGMQVTLADLVAAPVSLTITGTDLSSAVMGGLFIDNTPGGECVEQDFLPVTTTATTAVFNIGVVSLADAQFCYNVAPAPNANPQIAAQTFSAAIDLTPAPGTTTVDPASALVGEFVQNGTVLKVPYLFSNKSGTSNFVHLSNNGNAAAPYTVSCLSNGVAPANGTAGSIPAKRSLTLSRADVGCPGTSNTAIFTINSATGNVIGSMVRTNTSSGDAGFDAAIGSE